MKINSDLSMIVKPAESKTVKPDVKRESAKTINQTNDTIEISAEAKQKANNSNNVYFDLERFQEQLKNSKEQAKSEADAAKMRLKCQEIARRIMKGDTVPKEDHSYLMKNDPGMYMQATSLKMQNDNPKKHKRLSEDEETEGETSVAQVSGLGVTPETPASQSPDAVQVVDTEG